VFISSVWLKEFVKIRTKLVLHAKEPEGTLLIHGINHLVDCLINLVSNGFLKTYSAIASGTGCN